MILFPPLLTGLYPSRHGVWNNICNRQALSRGLKDGVRLWSEDLAEAEQFCHRVAIIDNGKKVIEGAVSDLINQQQGDGNLETLFLELTGRELRD